MFWGLIMEPNKRYTQTVEKSFHVSMASLDLSSADDTMVQVMLHYDGRMYLLCSLMKSMAWQVPLDLNFQDGTKIAFTCNGHAHVHLTGYLIPNEDIDLQELEEEEDNEVLEYTDTKQAKRKATHLPSEGKNAKRIKQEIEAQSSDEEDELSSDKDSEDSSSSHDNSCSVEEEEEDDDENLKDDDEDDNEEVPEKKSAKAQWHEKKKKQGEELQGKKKDKQKLMNGKEMKQLKDEQETKRQKKNKKEQQQQQVQVQTQPQEQKKRVTEGGVQIEDIKVGGGVSAKSGKFVTVYYVGRLKNGKKFDATTQGEGFKFRLGKGEVIKGWDIGISGMKIGGKRRITIPPALAYGAKGSPPVIPGNSTLIFEVELKNVH